MNILIESNQLYIDNHFTCFAEASNGRENLPAGRYKVAAQYSHAHGCDLPNAYGLGWIGPGDERDVPCDVLLGRVRARNGLIPCRVSLEILLHRIGLAEEVGQGIWLEVA